MSTKIRFGKFQNALQTIALVAAMLCVPAFLAYMLFGNVGLYMAAAMGGIGILLSPRISPNYMLRATGAQALHPNEATELYEIVATLASRARLSHMPRLYLLPSNQLNAFTIGNRDDAAIAVSSGLLRSLTAQETASVMAHEVAHIVNNDLWLLNLSEGIRRLTASISKTGIFLFVVLLPLLVLGSGGAFLLPAAFMFLAPLVSTMILLAISRTREFGADLEAARLMGGPTSLMHALTKLEQSQFGLLERLFGIRLRDAMPQFLKTHPATHDRIHRLKELREPGQVELKFESIPVQSQDTHNVLRELLSAMQHGFRRRRHIRIH